MDRETVDENQEPGYPSYNEFKENRRNFLKLLGAGVAGAAVIGCAGESQPPLMGEMPVPDPFLPPDDTPELVGELPAPQPPQPERLGSIAMPEDAPVLPGKPAPPKPPEPVPVPGIIVEPTPPEKVLPPEMPVLGGDIQMVDP